MSESFLSAIAARKEDAEPELPDLGALQISPELQPSVDPIVSIYTSTSTSGKIKAKAADEARAAAEAKAAAEARDLHGG